MRSFIAVDLSKEMKAAISGLQEKLKPYVSYGRWKYIDNFHLTLKFLDEIDDDMAEKVGAQLESISKENGRFALNISDIGKFQGNGNIRVLWLGLGGELDKLGKLQLDIEDGMHNLGFPKEKRLYKPHITIAQDVLLKAEFGDIAKIVAEAGFPDIQVEKIHLFKSEQIDKKRVYTSIQEYMLKK